MVPFVFWPVPAIDSLMSETDLAVNFDTMIAIAALAPFIAALAAPWVQRGTGALAGWILAAVPAALCVWFVTLLPQVGAGDVLTARFAWVPANAMALSFLVDGLSLTFAILISGIGALILVYSGAYLKGHRHQGRFLAFILAFLGAMQGLVLADNMVALFTFWELTSVTSFLLIGFDHVRQTARRAAIQALVVTGGGGLALLAGLVLLQMATGSWDLSAIRDAELGPALYGVVLTLVLLGAFTKSAQFPFHFWLPNAMEAPTPVSAFLHSATMVQGGVYLLARLSPTLGGTEAWTLSLTIFGGVTLLWGALAALRQTDLKQMLAQTTVASLGLLVLLIGVGTELALAAMVLYFVAHALYKAGLFLIAGVIDHETGLRDITALGGLRDTMAVSFIGTALAAIGMLGLPPALGFLAKEEMYRALAGDWAGMIPLVVLVLGNALLCAVALAVLIKPFLGPVVPTPKHPHEGPIAMLIGPLVLGVLGIAGGVLAGQFGHYVLAPMASAMAGHPVESHVVMALDFGAPALYLSVLTWVIGGLVYWQLDAARSLLRRLDTALPFSFDRGFDTAMFGLIRGAAAVIRNWHHGRLELYMFVIFAMLALALLAPFFSMGGVALTMPDTLPNFYEWAVIALAVCGVVAVLLARSRLIAVVSLGVQGLAVAMLYLLFGAPDLAFTQLMVEVLSVVILALVMTRLDLEKRDTRELEDLLRDGVVALACGAGVMLALMSVTSLPLPDKLAAFFTQYSVPAAHGHNIVNVILVDFRGLDTLGEISVVMTAGIAILALLRRPQTRKPPATPKPASRKRRSAA